VSYVRQNIRKPTTFNVAYQQKQSYINDKELAVKLTVAKKKTKID
jgi:hypothetical protein